MSETVALIIQLEQVNKNLLAINHTLRLMYIDSKVQKRYPNATSKNTQK